MFLNCHSWFSFNHGVMPPEDLLEQARVVGLRSFVLTDIHNTAGASDLVRLAPTYGILPVVGIEFRRGAELLYIGIAKNNAGFQRLNELLSPHLLDGDELPERPPGSEDVFFILPFSPHAPQRLRPNERIGIRPSDLTRLPFSPWAARPNDLVALLPVTFREATAKRDFNTHRLLRTVARNTVVSMLPTEELAAPHERFYTPAQVRLIYRDMPHLPRNAEQLLEQCSITFDSTDKTRKVFGAGLAEDREKLWTDTRAGLTRRYPDAAPHVLARMERELDVIERMGFISYFLINQDIVRFARSQGFFHVGRGSGANSIVAYCLGITDVDPIELDLYFERFISSARKKPPDFDIDFSWKDRDAVYRYALNKYNGSGTRNIHAAQLATYTTYQWRGAVRELGKAMGLPPEEIDALSESGGRYGGGSPSTVVRNGQVDHVAQSVVRYARNILGMPHQFGIHVGGILVSELPLTAYSALHRPPKGFPVVQFSMLEAEDLGLHKFDLLSQRGLGHIRDAVELVEARVKVASDELPVAPAYVGRLSPDAIASPCARASLSAPQRLGGEHSFPVPRIDIHDIPRFKSDPAIKELLRTGNTVGCFYVESPAMRMLLKKLHVEDYLTLVAASSIIRPGVAESGMMREYILRHNDPERRKLAPKALLEIMPETYGVMVYQEDVLRVAHHYAGLTLEEADLLRRGMTARFRERPEFKAVELKFFDNCAAKGHPAAQAQEVWRQIESFASFSFAKGHSASYAVESYQSLYLKAHHPLEFMVAVANNFGGFYNLEFYLHEAKRSGAVIEAPCVNRSAELCSLLYGDPTSIVGSELSSSTAPSIFIGLSNIKSLTDSTTGLLLLERRRNGPFTDIADLLRRVPLPLEQARILVRTGALRFTGRSKPQLLWDLALLHRPATVRTDGDLFIARMEEPALPDLQHYPLADAYDQLELLGFPLGDPFALVHESTSNEKSAADPATIPARDMPRHRNKHVRMLGYLTHVKTTTTNAGTYMSFGSFIDPAGDFWDSTQFPSVVARFPFRGRGVYELTGVVEEEFGHCSLRTQTLEKLPWRPDPRYGDK
ncbi:MAG: DNA polymerase III subunit alpha [Flavobacteriales bacterium]|nr:DNA polymerase III subunit alpha [Flavobacteriales bacterium]